MELSAFRDSVRDWLGENAPDALKGTATSPFQGHWGGSNAAFASGAVRLWFERCLAKGWTAPSWPKQFGGAALTVKAHQVLLEELGRQGLPLPLVGFGLTMIGPILLAYGTDAQKAEHLPKIVRGEVRWCQGYSEPNAGSDLASLQTRATLVGDTLVLAGQKVWTSHADKADWMFCLVRTDPDAKKQEGISFVVFDMRSPGVSVRPILLISGASPFCETFLTDVVVPLDQMIGPLHGGWTVAKSLLRHERIMVGEALAGGGSRPPVLQPYTVRDHAKRVLGMEGGRLDQPVIRDEIARHEMEYALFRHTLKRIRDKAEAGMAPGLESSIVKVFGTEVNQRRWDLAMRIAGPDGLGWEGEHFDEVALAVARQWLRSRGNSIEGGTNEIQRNIIATRVLGLPRGPR